MPVMRRRAVPAYSALLAATTSWFHLIHRDFDFLTSLLFTNATALQEALPPRKFEFIMNEEAELQARIAALSGQINQRKQQPFGHPRDARWAPYARRGRGGHQPPHKNRTLVLNTPVPQDAGMKAEPGVIAAPAPVAPSPAKDAFVSTRGSRMNQLMTKETFAREQKQRIEQLEQQRAAKRPRGPPSAPVNMASTARQPLREVEIEGIRFHLKEDGSKLIRIRGQSHPRPSFWTGLNKTDTAHDPKETPKKAKIADVEFYRTKNGNLVRMMAQNQNGTQRYGSSQHATSLIQDSSFNILRLVKRAPKPQCENFTKHGTLHPLRRWLRWDTSQSSDRAKARR